MPAIEAQRRRPEAYVHPTSLPRHDLRWSFQSSCPRDWWAALLRCGGGFFHTPIALAAVAPAGRPVFAQLRHREEVVGIAAGVESACRLSQTPRHVYIPTPPALICMPRREAALEALRESLHQRGAAQLTVDAFDARWEPDAARTQGEADLRLDYVVALEPNLRELSRRLVHHHRRYAERGERSGWTLRVDQGTEAWALLYPARTVGAVARSARAPGRADAWQATAFSAWDDGTPLAAALVGVAGRRAYCLKSRETPAGAERDAGIWLQWRIMAHLAEHDCDAYGMGSTTAGAEQFSHPEHDEFRRLHGFGAEVVPCTRARWTLRAGHMSAHNVADWLGRRLGSVA